MANLLPEFIVKVFVDKNQVLYLAHYCGQKNTGTEL